MSACTRTPNRSRTNSEALEDYVNDGGGLAIVPPAAPLSPDDLKRWNDALDAHHLLPARLRDLTSTPEGKPVYWDDFKDDHPLTRPFFDWERGANPDFADEELKPFVKRYWEVEPVEGKSLVISTYDDDGRSPALVELKRGEGDKDEKRGRVLLFTTRLNRPPEDTSDRDWNNFYDGSFGMVLINEACKYLAGDSSMENPNFVCGAPVVAAAAGDGAARRLPAERARPGPDRVGSEASPSPPGQDAGGARGLGARLVHRLRPQPQPLHGLQPQRLAGRIAAGPPAGRGDREGARAGFGAGRRAPA